MNRDLIIFYKAFVDIFCSFGEKKSAIFVFLKFGEKNFRFFDENAR